MKKALIVDDLDQNIYLLRSILEGDGFEVISAQNGAEALELARSNTPDIAISDILMPTMDGFALLREWKHDSLLQNIPLIIYTATYTDPRDEELALRLGAARFIVKPVEPEVFLDSVRQVMEADQAGHIPSPPCRIDDETVYYRMYNETLIRKLEHKMLALEQEIIQRKRDEETLWWKEEKYRTLFDGMSQGAFYQAADGRLTDVNQAALRMFGLTRQEFLERTSLSPARSVIREDGGLLPGDEHPSMAALHTGLPVKDMTVGILNPSTNEYTWAIVNAIPQFRPGESSPFQVYVTLHDITDRKQFEQLLKAFASRQESLLAAIPDVIMEVDANKVYAWANKAGIEFFGDDVVGREAAFYFEGEQETYDRVRNIFHGNEETVYVESWQRRRDGQKRLLAWWCHVLKDAGGNATGAISTARDITERFLSEKERLLMGEVLSASLNEIYIFDAETLKFQYVNYGALNNLGYSLEEMQNLTPLDLKPEFSPESFEQLVQPLISGLQPVQFFETVHRRADGSLYPVEVHLQYFRRPEQNVFFAVILDITKRKQAEEALKSSEYRQKAILNNTPDIAWIKDLEGKYITVNEAFKQAAQRPLEDILGKTDQDLWPPEMAEHYRQGDLRVMQTGRRTVLEEQLKKGNGETIQLESIKTPLYDSTGNMIGTAGIARDISERVKTEEELRMASQKWRDTFDAITDSVALLSIDGTVEQCNRAFVNLLGLDYPAVLGRKCHQLIHHTEDHIPDCPIVKSRESGVRETMELQAGEKFFLVVADPIKAPDGKITGFVHIMRDITERRRIEMALNATEAVLAEAQQIAQLGTWSYNPETEQFSCSDEINHILGLTVDKSLRYTDFMKYVHPDDYSALAEAWSNLRNENSSIELEYRIIRPSGEIRYIHEYSIYKCDDDSQLMRSAGLVHDITDQYLAQKELLLFKESVESSSDAIGLATPEGLHYYQNKAFDDLFGHIGYDPRLSLYVVEQIGTEVFDTIMAGGQWSGEVEMYAKDRSILNILLRAYAIKDQNGRITGLVGIHTDITVLKEALQALQAKNAELERFTYSISHDLRSPLVTIRTFMGHLAEDMALGDQEHVAQDLGYINTASQKMVALLDELLQLSRIGRMANPSVLAPLQDIVQEALTLVAGRIDERGVRVTVTEQPVLLYGDRVRLVEVFQNLVDNAAKFMGEQKAPLIEIGAENKNGGILCFVRDNGMGIEPRYTDKLFGLFEKLNSGIEGSGLGLALVKRIIEAHGGKIWAESEGPGKGACFWFFLPGK